jgi:hypothetical protein
MKLKNAITEIVRAPEMKSAGRGGHGVKVRHDMRPRNLGGAFHMPRNRHSQRGGGRLLIKTNNHGTTTAMK